MDRNSIFREIRNHVLAVLPDLDPDVVTGERNLAELGCNSVDRADILMMTAEGLGLDVPIVEFFRVANIDGLVEVLYRHSERVGAK